MFLSLFASCLGAALLVPGALVEWLRLAPRWRWPSVALALVACVVLTVLPDFGGSFARAVWGSLGIFLILFTVSAFIVPSSGRLAPLVLAYAALAGLLTIPFAEPVVAARWGGSLLVHILPALTGYGLITLAAVAGLAGDLQGRALRQRQGGWLNERLPSLQVCEFLTVRYLAAAVASLLVAVSAGMALKWAQGAPLLRLDHKSLLTIVALILSGAFLIAHNMSGLRGKQAVRWAMVIHLVLTLGFLGVKFVADILLGRG